MIKQMFTSPTTLRGIALCLLAFASVAHAEPGRKTPQQGSRLQAQAVWPDKQFNVDAAGNISPQQDYLHSGQTAVWTFATPSPANALVRQTWINPNHVAAPYDPTYVNEFMTPLPKGMSGIFVISENQGGLLEQRIKGPGSITQPLTGTPQKVERALFKRRSAAGIDSVLIRSSTRNSA